MGGGYSPPQRPTISGFWFLPDPAGYHSVMGVGAGSTCVYTHTHTDTLQAEKVASGLALWRRQASAIGPREHLNPGRPALSPWAGSWVSASGPPLFKAPLGHLGFPLSPPLGVLSTCLPALRRGWPPPLPSSPAPFPTQSYQAGADPASCCPVHTSMKEPPHCTSSVLKAPRVV